MCVRVYVRLYAASFACETTRTLEILIEKMVAVEWGGLQGWWCSRVESLVWQYDISELLSSQLQRQTGCRPLQLTVKQVGRMSAHYIFVCVCVLHVCSLCFEWAVRSF